MNKDSLSKAMLKGDVGLMDVFYRFACEERDEWREVAKALYEADPNRIARDAQEARADIDRRAEARVAFRALLEKEEKG